MFPPARLSFLFLVSVCRFAYSDIFRNPLAPIDARVYMKLYSQPVVDGPQDARDGDQGGGELRAGGARFHRQRGEPVPGDGVYELRN